GHLAPDHGHGQAEKLLRRVEVELVLAETGEQAVVDGLHQVHGIELHAQGTTEQNPGGDPDFRLVALKQLSERLLVAQTSPRNQDGKIIGRLHHADSRRWPPVVTKAYYKPAPEVKQETAEKTNGER